MSDQINKYGDHLGDPQKYSFRFDKDEPLSIHVETTPNKAILSDGKLYAESLQAILE